MIKLNRTQLRILTYTSLFTVVCSFVIAESLSINNKQEINIKNPLASGLPSLTNNLFSMGGTGKKSNQNLQPQLVKPPAKQDEQAQPVDKYHLKPQAFNAPTNFQGKSLSEVKVAESNKVIALTFDDGPWPKNTNEILEILKKNNIKATFFWVGEMVKNYPEIAKQVVAAGHAIGNHTWSHSYRMMSKSEAAKEIDKTAEIIENTTKVKTTLFRPPGGLMRNGPASYAIQQKYALLMWSADTIDYNHRSTVDRIVSRVLKNATPGGIVLMHDGGGDRSHTVQALPRIIDSLRKQGYKFVTIPELLKMEQPKEKQGTIADPGKKDQNQGTRDGEAKGVRTNSTTSAPSNAISTPNTTSTPSNAISTPNTTSAPSNAIPTPNTTSTPNLPTTSEEGKNVKGQGEGLSEVGTREKVQGDREDSNPSSPSSLTFTPVPSIQSPTKQN